jgi:hypothetical protein
MIGTASLTDKRSAQCLYGAAIEFEREADARTRGTAGNIVKNELNLDLFRTGQAGNIRDPEIAVKISSTCGRMSVGVNEAQHHCRNQHYSSGVV